ncbi:phage repressor protein [Salmonella enterica]|uniref:Phage repressor protein n=2 Tax=Salmonella enterica TaxID=28901 RepID=A0A5Y5JNT4_SALER|nr:phage repressor protein CI [Salmonella enterica]EAA5543876.1 phage repressor protein [Salmonella enterica subsp. enterica serovar Abony]EAB6471382.1 phage repressor protein [Salmonella enterica subsp. enterica]EBS3299549.1 phage repressor protein [Salmonella enterica subsp. enterica serovar Grumpensis]EBS4874445.1 phage repressor protein [Salmonella enterica subsp. enterica serovar Hvittingfoss]EBV3276255.1 phage repressor protein [Salmonella enterica subsp. enterica serovar Wangata]EBV410
MGRFRIDPETDSAPVLDRIIEAYGFTQKLQLAEHLDIAASSLSSRYKRGGLPADIMVKCMAETGVNLEWLATGQGRKFNDDELDILKVPRSKIVDGHLYDAGTLMLDKVMFLPGKPLPQQPMCVLDGLVQYIVDQSYSEVYDDDWLVEVEGKTSVRTLTRIPVGKVRVSGVGMAFDCAIDDISVIGRVVLIIN